MHVRAYRAKRDGVSEDHNAILTFCYNRFTSIPSDPSINEKGEVAFQGNPRRLTTRADCGTAEQRQRRQGVFLGKGGPLTTIAHTINPPGGDFIAEFLVADQSVNTFGKVAFVEEDECTDSIGVIQRKVEGDASHHSRV